MRKICNVAAGLLLGFAALPAFGVALDNAGSISEFANYREVYRLPIPTGTPVGGWNNAGALTAAYTVNNASTIPQGSFTRVAYYMELSGATNTTNFPNGWVWVSFDSSGFTNRADLTGVPSTTSTEFYQQNVSNMTVVSNVPSIVQGTGIATGNVEFWPSNYTEANTRAAGNGGPVPNAAGDLTGNTGFDFGDGGAGTSSGHGSMQVHNYDLDGTGAGTTGQTLFAYNSWGGGASPRTADLGVGNNPQAAQAPDWTLTGSAGQTGAWTSRTLQVFVTPEPSGLLLLAIPTALVRRHKRRA
jgi:hypothetical protein